MNRLALFSLLVFGITGPGLLPAQDVLSTNPSRAFGHPHLFASLTTASINYVEGREFARPISVAVDRSQDPPAVYVSDLGNNRVLGWRSLTGFTNGARADIVIGQVDFFTTLPQGPVAGGNPVGLDSPSGLLVDAQGNLWVADSGNNRILRFPRPFEQGPGPKVPDLVLGQAGFTTRTANSGGRSARSLSLRPTAATTYTAFMAFDGEGNLWATDPGNHRVLRYPAGALTGGGGIDANLVLGQSAFDTASTLGTSLNDRQRKDRLRIPAGLAIDSGGRVYVSDSLGRVSVFLPGFTNGKEASRIMGVALQIQGQPVPPAERINMPGAEGLFFIGQNLAVCDQAAHRVTIFPEYNAWPPETTQYSPSADAVIGQENFVQSAPNRSQAEPLANALRGPTHGAFWRNETDPGSSLLLLADSLNHRVLSFPGASFGSQSSATRVLGQDSFEFGGANLVEGRELALINRGGLAVDRSTDPPRLYVADAFNNRVLGFRSVYAALSGAAADLVLGQPDTRRVLVNFPNSDATRPNDSGLNVPSGVAVDADGNLWVADSGNGRVLRFPRPFEQASLFLQKADVVLGKAAFTSPSLPLPTATNLREPYDIAFTFEGHLLVSDVVAHRVVMFTRDPVSGFQNGQTAYRVFGQPGAFTGNPGADDNQMNTPLGIAIDNDDRLYVADSGNHRVLIFDRAPAAPENPRAARLLTETFSGSSNLRSPYDVLLDRVTQQFWVADQGNGRVVRYPQFSQLQAGATANGRIFGAANSQNQIGEFPLALTSSGAGDLLVAQSTNRISLYVPPLAAVSAASYLKPDGLPTDWPQQAFRAGTLSDIIQQHPPLCPSSFAAVFSIATTFSPETVTFDQFPDPLPVRTELAGVELRVNGRPAPLLFVSPEQINVLLPGDAPRSGTATLEAVRPATGQVVASSRIRMGDACPALFTSNRQGTGQIAAINEDGSINSATRPAPRRSVIALYGTGQGNTPGAPDDNQVAAGAVPTTEKPRVIINTSFIPDSDVEYSGLVPGQLGALWQINARIPESVPPGNNVQVVVVFKSHQSNQATGTARIVTTIAVSQ